MMGCSNKRATVSCSNLCFAAKTSGDSYLTTTTTTSLTSTTTTTTATTALTPITHSPDHYDITTAVAESYLDPAYTSMKSSCAPAARWVKTSSIFPDANYILKLELGQLYFCCQDHASLPCSSRTSMNSRE